MRLRQASNTRDGGTEGAVVDSGGWTWIGVVALVVVQGFSLIALWLRLRWRLKQEQVHRQYAVAVTRAIRDGGQVDMDLVDGSSLRIMVTGRPAEDDHG
jgi:hypothetical protein